MPAAVRRHRLGYQLDLSNIHTARECFDVPKNRMALLFHVGLLVRTRACRRESCNDGQLHAKTYKGSRYKAHGGWAFKCDGNNCQTKKPISILYGSIFENAKFTLQEFMWMFYYYCAVNHRVCANVRTMFV